jgi:hypothetical protein
MQGREARAACGDTRTGRYVMPCTPGRDLTGMIPNELEDDNFKILVSIT